MYIRPAVSNHFTFSLLAILLAFICLSPSLRFSFKVLYISFVFIDCFVYPFMCFLLSLFFFCLGPFLFFKFLLELLLSPRSTSVFGLFRSYLVLFNNFLFESLFLAHFLLLCLFLNRLLNFLLLDVGSISCEELTYSFLLSLFYLWILLFFLFYNNWLRLDRHLPFP